MVMSMDSSMGVLSISSVVSESLSASPLVSESLSFDAVRIVEHVRGRGEMCGDADDAVAPTTTVGVWRADSRP